MVHRSSSLRMGDSRLPKMMRITRKLKGSTDMLVTSHLPSTDRMIPLTSIFQHILVTTHISSQSNIPQVMLCWSLLRAPWNNWTKIYCCPWRTTFQTRPHPTPLQPTDIHSTGQETSNQSINRANFSKNRNAILRKVKTTTLMPGTATKGIRTKTMCSSPS